VSLTDEALAPFVSEYFNGHENVNPPARLEHLHRGEADTADDGRPPISRMTRAAASISTDTNRDRYDRYESRPLSDSASHQRSSFYLSWG